MDHAPNQGFFDALQDLTTSENTLSVTANEIGMDELQLIAASLIDNTNILVFKLINNPIGNEGAICMANILNSNQILSILDLRNCNITDEGAIALANSISCRTTPLALFLNENPISPLGEMALASAAEKNSCQQWISFSKISQMPWRTLYIKHSFKITEFSLALEQDNPEKVAALFHQGVSVISGFLANNGHLPAKIAPLELIIKKIRNRNNKIRPILISHPIIARFLNCPKYKLMLCSWNCQDAALCTIWCLTKGDNQGAYENLPLEIVEYISKKVWKTRKDLKWFF